MLVYYPLEHVYYFATHGILPSRFSPSSKLNNKLAIWSCRAWATYVALQFWHLKEDYRLIKLQEDSLKKTGVDLNSDSIAEQGIVISRRKAALWNELAVNISYLPLTVHWYVHMKICYDLLIQTTLLLGHWRRVCLPTRSVFTSFTCYAVISGIFGYCLNEFQLTPFIVQVLVGVFGTMAALFSVRSGWAASSLPTPPSTI